jgi:UPF0716 protein FxsA
VPLLILIFIVVPIVELYVIIQVGQAIGALWTIAILIADSLLGSALLRSQGRAAWRRFRVAVAEGRPPAREVIDGALIIFGGAFLITPGFVTDVIGVLLLLPPTRAAFRALLVRRFRSRLVVSLAGAGAGAGRARRDPRARHDYDVEGTARESDQERLGR